MWLCIALYAKIAQNGGIYDFILVTFNYYTISSNASLEIVGTSGNLYYLKMSKAQNIDLHFTMVIKENIFRLFFQISGSNQYFHLRNNTAQLSIMLRKLNWSNYFIILKGWLKCLQDFVTRERHQKSLCYNFLISCNIYHYLSHLLIFKRNQNTVKIIPPYWAMVHHFLINVLFISRNMKI